MNLDQMLDVVIVGGGPAGLGCAAALRKCGIDKMLVLERDSVGASFIKWTKQMRLITPSFFSNPFNQIDLNAITPDSSVADYLQQEHPGGRDYARYLQACVEHYKLPVETEVEVQSLTPMGQSWQIITSRGLLKSRFVIWAIGEFSRPDSGDIKDHQYGLHNSRISDWNNLIGDSFVVVGGYESGVDAAVQLAWRGKRVSVLSRGEPWHNNNSDPSNSLSPRTRDRLREALSDAPGDIRFYRDADVSEIEVKGNQWCLKGKIMKPFESATRPILCTGFKSAVEPIKHLFAEQDGRVIFSEESDESTLHSGLFYSGPSLSHRESLFCFIYKFRSRFGIIARTIADRLGLDWEEPLRSWRESGFMMEDLSCCTDCQCAVQGEEDEPAQVLELASQS